MTLYQLSQQYRVGAGTIQARIQDLTAQMAQARDESIRLALRDRVRILSSMRRDMLEIANLTEHYYERGYYRSETYLV